MTQPFLGCIQEAEDAQEIAPEAAATARDAYADGYAGVEALGPEAADRAGARAALTALEHADLLAKRRTVLAVRTRRGRLADAWAYLQRRGYTGRGPPGRGDPPDGSIFGATPPPNGPFASGGAMADWLKELIEGEGGLAGGSGASVKGRHEALMGGFQGMMADLMDRFEEVSGLGRRGKALLTNIVHEAFGEKSGDPAAEALAKTWADTADYGRELFNAAGGDIGKLEAWGLPQAHDGLAVRKMGREAWAAFTAPLLNRAKMIDRVTGLPFSDKRLGAVLGEVWDSIVTDGSIDRAPGAPLGNGMVAGRRGDPRFLVYKDATSWLAYQRQLGMGDPYVAMMRHLDGLARDTARMQVLGPNPDHTFEWLAKVALREADIEQAGGAKPQTGLKQAEGDVDSARKMYGLYTGELARPYGADNWIAHVGAATRAGLSAVQLGAAVINDVTSNPVYSAQVRAFAGLHQTGGARPWLEHIASTETRQSARRTGFILQSARVRHAGAVQQFLRAQTVGGKIVNGANAFARMLPTWVQRASLLETNRSASRFAFQHEFMGRLTDLSGKDLAALAGSVDASERAFGEILQARGFTPAEWDLVRAVTPEEPVAGARFLSPQAIGHAGHAELGWRVAEMIEREARQAFPESSLWAQAQLLGTTRPGTVQGEIMRSLAAYRSFTVTQTYRWAREFLIRGMDAAEGSAVPWQLKAATLAAPLMIGATLSGAAAVVLKDIARGNDPRPMWDADPKVAPHRAWTFWAQAAAQGGGQGILGDFFTSVQSRAGKSAAMTGWGAPAAFASDTWNVTGGEVGDLLQGEDPHFGRDVANYVRRYSPLSSLWWSRAAWDRAVADQLQKALDPDAAASFSARAQRLHRELGESQWWPAGQPLPSRAPSLGTVVGEPPPG